ncbi:hypothetical protein G7046_g3869 [Stylonectria norvegica]|nr:hypothetical protein G7046_g3869 [Stylonectria norvegica]
MTEPIAVIGFDAKLPCDGDTPEQFYEFLLAGRSARGPVPKERYNADAFWNEDNHRDGIIGGKEGHFINANVKAFDAPFFSITPAEAASMDPQQRMLLECVYTALENSGLPMHAVQGSQTGCYVGAFIWDYRDVLIKDVEAPMMYTGSGTIASTLAGRVNWFYDFQGPAMSIDTACSSSMVALHQAIVGLKAGDCDMALACGTNLILSPEMGLELNALGVLNPDSVSYSFDERANGYGRSEGIGAIVLKRMSDALRDGDTIRAVIRNTGCNHDGHSPGLTAPAQKSQVSLMRKVYAQAGLDPADTQFFEAHGTGTAIGDPIEAGAISEMFTPYRTSEAPLFIGAVKSNIGHSEGASGIASVIKGILTVENGIIPANTWFEKRNKQILDEWHFHFPTKATPWPQSKTGLRRMSINSFGVSGTNAHVVMEDALHFLREHGYVAPHRTVNVPRLPSVVSNSQHAVINGEIKTETQPGETRANGEGQNGTQVNGNLTPPSQLFILSSFDQDGISRLCNVYKDWLPSFKGSLSDVSFTLAAKRTRFTWRTAIIANSVESLQIALSEKQRVVRAVASPGLAFVFTGQGAQWARMGMSLMASSVFRESVDSADAYLKSLGCSWSVSDEFSKVGDVSRVNEAELSQPLCTVLQVALVELLASWGVTARAVVGHSSGEIAAAFAVGAISRQAAWKIAYWRVLLCLLTRVPSRFTGNVSATLLDSQDREATTMAAVGLDLQEAQDAIDKVNKSGFEHVRKLTVACMNSKNSHTISGDVAQIDALVEALGEKKIFARKLAVQMAYHSTYMQPMSQQYADLMGAIQPGTWSGDSHAPRFFSSTFGTEIGLSKLQSASYWTKNLVSPVLFYDAVAKMLEANSELGHDNDQSRLVTDLLEVGPHAALKGPLRNIIDEVRGNDTVTYHHMLKRHECDVSSSLQAAGSLFTRGISIDLVKVNQVDGQEPSMLVGLPRYPFNHSKDYWYESRLSRNFRNRAYPRHELLGAPVSDWDGKHDAIWRNWIRISENPWVEHHTVAGSILYPAAGMLVMAIEGCRQLAERSNPEATIKGFRFREVSFHSALRVPDDTMGIESHLYLRPTKQAGLEAKPSVWREFQLCTAQDDDEWREHCRGQILIEYDVQKSAVDQGREDEFLQQKCTAQIDEARQCCTSEVATEALYDGWSKTGLVFGPTFQTVTKSFVDHDSGRAFAKVDSTLSILKEIMPGKSIQPHLVHPTALDAALQVCLVPLISNPAQEQQKAVVLTFVDELWVSGTPHSDEGYLVCAETEPQGRTKYNMACTAVSPSSKEPMILVKGLVVSEVDSDQNMPKTDDDPRHQAWHIEWRPDVELLHQEDSLQALGTTNTLQKYLDALAHKTPSLKVLELHAGKDGTTENMMSVLGRRFEQYDATNAVCFFDDEAWGGFSDERARFQVLDISKTPLQQGLEAETYDAVIAPAGLEPNTDIQQTLSNIILVVKPGGKLVMEVQTTEEPAVCGLDLVQAGFTGVNTIVQNEYTSVMVSTAPLKDTTNGETSIVSSTPAYHIVFDPASDRQKYVAERLSSIFSAEGQAATSITISDYAQVSASMVKEQPETTCILLPELDSGLLMSMSIDTLPALQSMMNCKRLIWVNKDGCPDTDLVTGFAACVRLERPELDFVIVTFHPEEQPDTIVEKLMSIDAGNRTRHEPIETSYKVIDGVVHVPRLVQAADLSAHIKKQTKAAETAEVAFGADPTRSLSLRIGDIGLLDTIYFDDDPLYAAPLGPQEVEFLTMATAVNFKDLAVMLGKINETPVGLEAAGLVTRVGSAVTRFSKGDRVFGFAFNGAFSTHVRALEGTITCIPEGMSFSEAAVIPIVYTTAYACLYDIGDLEQRVRRGLKTSILVHAAAGGVGQAVIQLAQREGAEIYATVGSIEKRDFLEDKYGLQRDHIFSSRDVSFKDGISRMTNGRGVDIVINSLSGDMLRATWECVAPFGRFAEIGLSDIESRARISMGTFARGARFEAIELNYMQQTDMGRIEYLFKRAMDSALGLGIKRVTPITAYTISDVQNALRFMQSGKHIGKLVIEPHRSDIVSVVQPPQPFARFDSDASYVISGGFGGLGREIISWMVDRGAKNLIVISRRGAVEDSAQALVADLQFREDINILAPACDITDKTALQAVVSSCLAQMPPIRGCIQASSVLNDTTFNDMTIGEWQRALGVKSTGSWNLWETLSSKNADKSLDFFVMLSSMASIIGNPGQTNYAAGNSYQDALARYLSAQGHNSVALNVPMMNDAGMVATKPQLMDYLFSIGWSHMSAQELIAAMDYYCHPIGKTTTASTQPAQVVPRLWLPQYSAAEGAIQPAWQREPRFNHMVLQNAINDPSKNQDSGKGSTMNLLTAAKSAEEAALVVLDALLEKLSKILCIDTAELDSAKPMHAYGVDSLVAVELRTWMTKEIGSDVSVFEITGGQPIKQLAVKGAQVSRFLSL